MEVPGQKFALVSFIKEADKVAMRVLGAFSDEETAQKHCKQLIEMNDKFDIYMTSMYNWVPCAPSKEQIQEEHFSNRYVEELMTSYEAAQRDAQREFETRKQDLLEKARLERETQLQLNKQTIEEGTEETV